MNSGLYGIFPLCSSLTLRPHRESQVLLRWAVGLRIRLVETNTHQATGKQRKGV